jgi:hypothetical protein
MLDLRSDATSSVYSAVSDQQPFDKSAFPCQWDDKLMRRPREIAFRLRQEAANFWLLATKPAVSIVQKTPLVGLPDPGHIVPRLRGTPFVAELEQLAESILRRRFPLLGFVIDAGPEIAWRRDYIHHIESSPLYFRRIPYLDFASVGDHKLIWELNRHQHFVVLAQAFRYSGRQEYFEELVQQMKSWWATNPFEHGINWTSALEVAFRTLSWIWVYHLVGRWMEESFRQRFLTELYRHGRYLESNLSIYFSPNTHLLGEAVALHALGALFSTFPSAQRWRRKGARLVEWQMETQVCEDGSHFEQSTYYHVYALDFFLFHQVLAETPPTYRRKLALMAEYLAALLGPTRTLPFLGDDDGGRVFHPYGPSDRFARATLATCSVMLQRPAFCIHLDDLFPQALWWLGPKALDEVCPHSGPSVTSSRRFTDAGLAVMQTDSLHVLIDAGPFGSGSGGHSHADTLSIVVRCKEEHILIDPGAYTYVTDLHWRNWFRGAAAHNTIRIDRLDQATPVNCFRWTDKPTVELADWANEPAHDYLDAVCRYTGFSHRRRVLLLKPGLLFIVDEVDGPPGEHLIEQFWHPGEPTVLLSPHCFRIGACATLHLACPQTPELSVAGEHGWRSPVFGSRIPSPVIRVSQSATLPVEIAALLDFSGRPPAQFTARKEQAAWVLQVSGPCTAVVHFPSSGRPDFPLPPAS